METHSYPPPLDRLLTLGEPRNYGVWSHDETLGLTRVHIPDLIRMATDEALHLLDSSRPEVWAPVHAWRALGHMKATEAVDPLLGLLHLADDADDDWIDEELPEIFGMMGAEAIPSVAAYLRNSEHGLRARIAAARGLEKIADNCPEQYDTCAAILTDQLRLHERSDETLNAFLITVLIHLKALDSIDVIREAFEKDRVDEGVCGDIEEVEAYLGLRELKPVVAPFDFRSEACMECNGCEECPAPDSSLWDLGHRREIPRILPLRKSPRIG